MATKPYHYKVKTEPYDHQVDAFHFCYGKDAFALFMEQGTGKTKVAIDIASNLYIEGKIDSAMVIAPNGVHAQWIQEQLPIHSPVKYTPWVWKAKSGVLYLRNRDIFMTVPSDKLKWLAVNVEAFSTNNYMKVFLEFLVNNRTFIIVDESTRIKNPTANRTINIMYNLAKKVKKGRSIKTLTPYSSYRAILSGMMVTNSPYDLWSPLTFLEYNYFKCNYFAFKAKYGIEVRDIHPGTGHTYNRKIRPDEIERVRKYAADGKEVETIAAIIGMSETSVRYLVENPNINAPYKKLDELKAAISPISFIVRKDDCLDLPPKVYSQIHLEMNAEQKRIYKELEKKFVSMYNEQELTVQNKLTLIGRLQQVTGGFFPYEEGGKGKIMPITNKNPKIERLVSEIEETGDECIIVWARFVGELKMIYDRLTKAFPEKRIALYYGGISKEKREKIKTAFTQGEIDIFVANLRTAGIGLNLQLAHIQIYFSNSYSLDDREQGEDRSHRIGQNDPVLYKDMIMLGTVDEKVFDVLKTKKNLLEYFRSSTVAEFLG